MEFAGHVLDGLVQAQAGLDRDHQQIQRVGQRETQSLLPLGDLLLQKEPRQNPARADAGGHEAKLHHRIRRHLGFHHDAQHQHQQGDHDAHAVENRQRVLRTEARADQVGLQVGDLGFRRGHARPEAVEERHQRAGLGFAARIHQPLGIGGDHRPAQLAHELAGLVDQTVTHPAEDDHQHEERADREYCRMFHIQTFMLMIFLMKKLPRICATMAPPIRYLPSESSAIPCK